MRTRQNPETTTDNIVFDFGGLKCPNISIEISSDAQTTITPKESMVKMFEKALADKGVTASVDLSNYSITLGASVTDDILDESAYLASIKFVDQIVAASGRAYTVKLEKHVESFEFSPGSVILDLSSRETPLNVSNPFSTVSVSKINFNEDPFIAAILQHKEFSINGDSTFSFKKSILNAFITLCPSSSESSRTLSSENVAFVSAASMNGRGNLETLIRDNKIILNDVFTTLDISSSAVDNIKKSMEKVKTARQRKNPEEKTVSVGVINDFSDIGENYTEEDVRNSHDSFNDFLNDYFQENFNNNKNLTVASPKAALLGNNTSKLFDVINTYAGVPSYSMRLDNDGRDYSNAENQKKAYEKVKFVAGTEVTYIGNIAEPESTKGMGEITILPVSARAEGRRTLTRRNPREDKRTAHSSNSAAQLLLQLMGITFNNEGSLNTKAVEGGQLSPTIAPNTDFLAAFYILDAVQMIENRFLDHSSQMPPSLVRTMAEVISSAGADVDQTKLEKLNKQRESGRYKATHSELFAYLYGSSTSKSPNFSVLDNILDGRFTYSAPTPKEGEKTLSSVSYEDVEIYLPILYSYIRAQTEPLNILLTVLNFPERLFTSDYTRSNPVRSKDMSDLVGPYGTLSLHPDKWRQMYFEKLHIACSKYSPSLTTGSVEWSCTYNRAANDAFVNIQELEEEIRSYLEQHDAGLENLFKTYSTIINNLPLIENQPDCREKLKTSPLVKGLQSNPPNLTEAYKQIDQSGKTGALLGKMSGYDFEGHLRYLVSTLALFMTTFQQNGLFGALSVVKNGAMHLNLKPSLSTFGNAITGLLPAVTEYRIDIRNSKELPVAEMTILPLTNSPAIKALVVNPDVTYSEMITRNEILADGNDDLLRTTLEEYSRKAGKNVTVDDLGDNILVKRIKPRASTSTTVPLGLFQQVLAHNTSVESERITSIDVGAELSFPIAAPISKSAVDNVGASQLVVVTQIGLQSFYTASADAITYNALINGFPAILERVLKSVYSVLEVSLVTSTGSRISRLKRNKDYLNTDLQDALEIVLDNGSQMVQRKAQGTTGLIQSIFEGELYDVTDESTNKQIQRPLKTLKKDADFIRSQAAKRKEAVELLECYELAGQGDPGCEAVANKYLAAMKQKLAEKMRSDEVRGRIILAACKKVEEARSTLQNVDKLQETTGDFSYLEIVTYSPTHQEASSQYYSVYTDSLTEESEKQLEQLGVGLLVETLITGLKELRVDPTVVVQTQERERKVFQLSNYNRPKDKGPDKASFLIAPAQYFAYMMIMADVYARLAPQDANYPIMWMNESGGKLCAFSVVQNGKNYRYPTNAAEKAKVKTYLEFQTNQYGTCIGKPSYGHYEGALEQKYFFVECSIPGVMSPNNDKNPYPFATGEFMTSDNTTFSCKENRAYSNGTAFTNPSDSSFNGRDFMLHLPRHKQTNLCAVATYMGWLHDAIACGQKFDYSSSGFASPGERISICGALNIFYHILTGNQMGAHFNTSFLEECIQMTKKANQSNGYSTLLQYANNSEAFYIDLIVKDDLRKAFPALAAAYAQVSTNNTMSFAQLRAEALKGMNKKELEKDPVLLQLLTTNWNSWTKAVDPNTDAGRTVLKSSDNPGKFLYCTVKINR